MKPTVRWDGAVAIVTGASRGIGRGVALAAASRGAKVGLIARSRDDLESVLAETGGNGAVATADVSDRAEVERAVAELASALGDVDILVNNAGIGAYERLTTDTAERLMEVNYLGTLYPTMAVVPGMYARGRGHVVNVASVAGRMGAPLESAYCATKFAVTGLTEAFRPEANVNGVGVSLVQPGPVATDFFDARGEPYARKFPRPVSVERVVKAVMRAVDRGRFEQYVPHWLGAAHIMKTLFPPMYRAGTPKPPKDG